ncbi:MAG: hypothetical protein Q8R08_02030 [bacterium]|nr:hypothetical protein [bacterium]
MIDFTKIWDPKYLFGPNPTSLSRSDHIFFWIAIVFIVAAVGAKIFSAKDNSQSPKKYLFRRLFALFLTSGLLTMLWVGSRYENIPWLSTHFVVLIILLSWFIWLAFIGKYVVKNFFSQQKLWEEEELKRKYLTRK